MTYYNSIRAAEQNLLAPVGDFVNTFLEVHNDSGFKELLDILGTVTIVFSCVSLSGVLGGVLAGVSKDVFNALVSGSAQEIKDSHYSFAIFVHTCTALVLTN